MGGLSLKRRHALAWVAVQFLPGAVLSGRGFIAQLYRSFFFRTPLDSSPSMCPPLGLAGSCTHSVLGRLRARPCP